MIVERHEFKVRKTLEDLQKILEDEKQRDDLYQSIITLAAEDHRAKDIIESKSKGKIKLLLKIACDKVLARQNFDTGDTKGASSPEEMDQKYDNVRSWNKKISEISDAIIEVMYPDFT